MLYRSTRGGSPNTSFEDALFSGYAPDGGLFMPQEVPRLSPEELKAWAHLSYRQVMEAVARKFISEEEVPSADLTSLVESALSRFPKDSEVCVKNVMPDNSDSQLWVLELFHGPTLVFKDLALSFVAALLQYFLARRRRQVSIVVATSGDTGGSAIAAVEGRPDMDLVVLLPEGRISEPQRLQMVTSRHSNITVYAGEGTSDELDVPVKALFSDPAFVARHNLLSINSINVGRIIGQVAHFVFGYYRRSGGAGPVEVVVPTGAAGNITSAALAAALGLPLTAVCATNANDVTAKLLATGRYRAGRDMVTCLASAMDIQAPYNVERLLYLYSNKDVGLVKSLMTEFEAKGEVDIPSPVMKNMKQVITDSCSYPDSAVLSAIRRTHAAAGYLLCPHTAEGVALHYDRPSALPRLYAAPAAPAKFPEVVRRALGHHPPLAPASLEAVMTEVCRPLTALRKLAEGGTNELKLTREEDWKKVLEDRLEVLRAKRGE